jgi:hypothetical protein
MLHRPRIAVALLLTAALAIGSAQAADLTSSLKSGTPDLKSIGPLAFAPDGVLFIGDTANAAIFAIDTGDRTPSPAGPFKVQNVDEKIAAMLGSDVKQLQFRDMTVNPASGKAYMSIMRGRGPDASPVLVRVDREGKIEEVSLKNVKFAKAELPNAPSADAKDQRGTPRRQSSITSLVYVDGKVYVAGLSNEEFASTLRAIPFPFTETNRGTGIEIFHGAHGKLETHAPIRTFTTYKIDGQDHLLAAYTCTPLVKIPVADLKPGAKVRGTTVAELGNRNNPLDMVIYQKDGKDYILMANSSRGVMKITLANVGSVEGITARPKTETAGLPYDVLKELKNNVQQLARLDKEQALVLVQTDSGLNLESMPLP